MLLSIVSQQIVVSAEPFLRRAASWMLAVVLRLVPDLHVGGGGDAVRAHVAGQIFTESEGAAAGAAYVGPLVGADVFPWGVLVSGW
jgi:hypothetical protein